MMNEPNFYDLFEKSFMLDENKYLGIERHNNSLMGFSAYILPTDKLKSRLKIDSNFEYRSLFAVYYNNRKTCIENLQPLIIRLVFAQYRKGNDLGEYILDYSKIKRKDRLPIEIFDDKNVFFDEKKHKVCDGEGDEIDIKNFIDELYEKHVRLSKGLNNIEFRMKVFYRRTFPKRFFSLGISIFNSILKFITSSTVESPYMQESKSLDIFQNEDEFKKRVFDDLKNDFFGLKVDQLSLFSFSLLHLIGFFLFSYFEIYPTWVKQILEYNFLTIIYAIVSYTLYTNIAKWIFSPIVKLCYRKYNFIINRKILP